MMPVDPAVEPLSADTGEPKSEAARRLAPTWRAVVDALSDPAVILDRTDAIVHHNPLSVDFFPHVRAGQHLSQISRSPELLEAVARTRSSEERAVAELLDRVPFERRLSAIITRLGPRPDLDGAPELLIVFRDITDQEKLAQMRADFIANASHELRTPLASLKGFVETLQGPARNDPVAREKFLAMMATQAGRMSRLIDDLLSLSRAEMRVHLPPRGIVDLNEVATFVTQSLQPQADSMGANVTLQLLPGLARVRGERDELTQALQNLVQNAIKYGHRGGRVDVQIGKDRASGRLALSVADDGPGIAEHHLPRLTERFYRVNVANSRDRGGTGLGLAIVKHIVARHRGELQITSEVGKGSVFTVMIDAL